MLPRRIATILSVLLFDQPYYGEFHEWTVIKRRANAVEHIQMIKFKAAGGMKVVFYLLVILFSMLPTFEFNSFVISRNNYIDRSVFAYQH